MSRGIAHRDWSIGRDEFRNDFGSVDETAFRAAVEQEMALGVHLMERLGVAMVVAPVRRRVEGGGWYTDRYLFKTDSVPAAREPGEVEALEDALAEPALVEDPDALAEVE